MYDWYEMTEHEKIELYRSEYRRLGLGIFESFEEYMQDKEDEQE
jgi:hypothetical protein